RQHLLRRRQGQVLPHDAVGGPLSISGSLERRPGSNSRSTAEKELTMKYLCLAYGEEEKFNAMTQSELDDLIQKTTAYEAELKRTGRLISGMSLGWAATTLRRRNGKLSVTDGPFTETKEVVGGLVLIEARNLDEAIEVASLHPAARMGEELGWGLEIRPIEENPPCKPQPADRG